MKVECIRTLNGPNVSSYRPVLLMSLDLAELVERESREFNGFNNKLLTLLRGIYNHIQTALRELAAQPVIALPPPAKQESSLGRLRPTVNRPRRFGKRIVPAMPPPITSIWRH